MRNVCKSGLCYIDRRLTIEEPITTNLADGRKVEFGKGLKYIIQTIAEIQFGGDADWWLCRRCKIRGETTTNLGRDDLKELYDMCRTSDSLELRVLAKQLEPYADEFCGEKRCWAVDYCYVVD